MKSKKKVCEKECGGTSTQTHTHRRIHSHAHMIYNIFAYFVCTFKINWPSMWLSMLPLPSPSRISTSGSGPTDCAEKKARDIETH